MFSVLFEIYYFADECGPSETHYLLFECDHKEQIEIKKRELKRDYPTALIRIVD